MTFELALSAIAAGVLFVILARHERRGTTTTGLGVVLAVIISDAVLHPVFEQPPGIFHPSIAGQSFRLPEVLIPLVLAARLVGRGMPTRVSLAMLWWAAFALWYFGSAVVGLFAHNQIDVIFFEAKAIIGIVGGLVVAAGVPPDALLARLPIWIRRSAIAATILLLLAGLRIKIDLAIPSVPLHNFGLVGADAATILAGVGVIAITVGCAQPGRRGAWLLSAVPLLTVPFLSNQRAGLLGLTVSVVLIGVAWTRPSGRRGLVATPTEIAVLVLAVAAVLATLTFVPAALSRQSARPPLLNELETTLASQGKAQSAQSRENQWHAAIGLTRVHPVMGWGLGNKYQHYEQGPDMFISTDITHDVPLDVLVRSGIIGLLLLVVASCASVRDGVSALARADANVVGLVIGSLAFVAAILTKGLVESVLEKYLLAAMLGLILGVLRSARAATSDHDLSAHMSEVGSAWS